MLAASALQSQHVTTAALSPAPWGVEATVGSRPDKFARKLVPFSAGLAALLATRTRPHMSLNVSMLEKCQYNPGPEYWRLLKHFALYVNGSNDYVIYTPHRNN